MLEDFDISQEGDWFSFAKVTLCFLCSCKQTLETSISQRGGRACVMHTSYVIRQNGFHIWQIAEVIEKCLWCLKYGYFSYKNAWIGRPLFMPWSRVRHCQQIDKGHRGKCKQQQVYWAMVVEWGKVESPGECAGNGKVQESLIWE